MRIGILGSGLMGGKLGTLFARSGHDVVFSYARSPAKLKRLAKEAGNNAHAGTPAEATQDADALLLAVHWLRTDDVLIIATKTQDVAGVLGDWAWQPVADKAVAAEVLPVICAQNGVASERFALRLFRHVYGMYVWLPATHLEPGTVYARAAPLGGVLGIGRYPSGTDATIERIGADLAASRLLAPVVADVIRIDATTVTIVRRRRDASFHCL